jgi:uncharacterized protein YwlG (UPF0340 family)
MDKIGKSGVELASNTCGHVNRALDVFKEQMVLSYDMNESTNLKL